MANNDQPIIFILLPGFSPDSKPVLHLKEKLEERGYCALASNFYGNTEVLDFSKLTIGECKNNISQLIKEVKKKNTRLVGIGMCLGGALLLDYAKNENFLDAIISIGTPFKIKNKRLMILTMKAMPVLYPLWRILDKIKGGTLPPVWSTNMVIDYLSKDFLLNMEKVSTPVLFIHSKKDKIADYRVLDEYFEKISSPKKEVVYFDNGGHVINGGTEKALELMFNFLDEI